MRRKFVMKMKKLLKFHSLKFCLLVRQNLSSTMFWWECVVVCASLSVDRDVARERLKSYKTKELKALVDDLCNMFMKTLARQQTKASNNDDVQFLLFVNKFPNCRYLVFHFPIKTSFTTSFTLLLIHSALILIKCLSCNPKLRAFETKKLFHFLPKENYKTETSLTFLKDF